MTKNEEVQTTGGEDSTAKAVWVSLPKWLDDPQTPPEELDEAITKAYLAEQEKNEE